MGQRPAHLKPPEHLSKNPPVPEPRDAPEQTPDPRDRNPTRYGDWELKGVAIDF